MSTRIESRGKQLRLILEDRLDALEGVAGTLQGRPGDAEDLATLLRAPARAMGLQWLCFAGADGQAVRDDGEYYAWTHEGEYGPMTEQIRKYSRVDFASAWSWDTKVLYRPDWARGVGVSLEVYNVTNNRNASDVFVYKGTQYKSYDPGRQFWVQLSYDY